MIGRLQEAFGRHPVLTSGFFLAIALFLFFTIRLIVFTVYWANPAHRDRPIEGWMTPRYVIQSWHLPPEVMREALGEAGLPDRRMTMDEIAAAMGISLNELAVRVELAARAHREARE